MYDLHCHTTHSDGSLTPPQLLARAIEHGVSTLAITDHDVISGVREAKELCAKGADIQLVNGVELSCVWSKVTIHVVGLNFDLDHSVMAQALASQQQARSQRAELIGQRLARAGFAGCYEGALAIAGQAQLGRPHFAQYLVEQGLVASHQQAFKRYLGAGKTGDVKATWPELATVVRWITGSGGVAVLAHPLHYKMTATKLRALIADFKTAGGQGIEVISGRQESEKTRYIASLAARFELLASQGSDFHRPGSPWSELGVCEELPSGMTPVWSLWN